MYCCLTGAITVDPVVCKVTGCLFDRLALDKHMSAGGKCPVSGQTLIRDDIMPLRAGLPKEQSARSVPTLLQELHREWDAMLQEQFSLRQQLAKAQQELS